MFREGVPMSIGMSASVAGVQQIMMRSVEPGERPTVLLYPFLLLAISRAFVEYCPTALLAM